MTAGPRSSSAPSASRETILVVDDEGLVRQLASRILRESGYLVFEAPDGRHALQLLGTLAERVHLLVTDLVMPDIDGRELGGTATRCWPHLRVLYMSGYAGTRMMEEGLLDPGLPFLQKPFTAEQLTRKVRGILEVPRGPRLG